MTTTTTPSTIITLLTTAQLSSQELERQRQGAIQDWNRVLEFFCELSDDQNLGFVSSQLGQIVASYQYQQRNPK